MSKRQHISIILALMLLAAGQVLTAQLIRVSAEAGSDSIATGELLVLQVEIVAAENVEFQLIQPVDSLGKLELLSSSDPESFLRDREKHYRQQFTVTSFEPGARMVPALEVSYRFKDHQDTARSMPYFITVWEPVIDSAAVLKPLKAPMNTPVSLAEVAPYAGIGLGGIALVLLFIFFILPLLRKETVATMVKKPEDPPHVIAFRELDRLKENELWKKGEVKQYYSFLSRIIREYVERQYQIPAMESITGEILTEFRRQNKQDYLQELLEQLLQLSDLVKFAKSEPTPEENLGHLNNVYIFVQKTYPDFHREEVGDE